MLPAPDPVIVTKDADSTGVVIAVVVIIVVLVVLNLLFCHFCIRRQKKRIESLETEKVDWSTQKAVDSVRKPQLVAVGDAVPDEESVMAASLSQNHLDVADDSARRPFYEEE